MTLPDTVNRLDTDHATQAWDLLSQRVDAFITRWEAEQKPPPLAEFLPSEPPVLRRLALVELIKVDLEYRWQEYHLPRTLAEYLAEFPELAAGGGVPCDLIYEEFHIRKQAGQPIDAQRYLEQFPQQAAELGKMLGLDTPHVTTAMFKAQRIVSIEVGQRVDEFDLLKQLGKGAFATVFLAWQTTMQRFVALKVSADQGTEPQTLAQLEHEHIVRVYDQKVLKDRKLRLMYMQHIAGGTLQGVVDAVRRTPSGERSGKLLFQVVDRTLERAGKSPPAESWTRRKLSAASWPTVVCWLGCRLAAALDYAHRRNTLHRDVKPANVLLTDEGSPKLADFNISYNSQIEGTTPAAYFGGSLPYMSVEQLEACSHLRKPEELDGRSDVFSLGILLWELLTSSRPFEDALLDQSWSETLEQMTARRKEGVTAATRRQLPSDCPPGLEDTLLRSLAPDRDERYANAGQLARQLELCLRPRTQDLFRPKRAAWRQVVRRHAFAALAVAALLPNAAITLANIIYNRDATGLSEELKQYFGAVMVPTVNAIVYPIGIAVLCYLTWPVGRAVMQLSRQSLSPSTDLSKIRWRCLEMGEYVAWVSFYGWMATGTLLPLWIDEIELDSPGLDVDRLTLFLMSHALCGLIGATLSFFLVTFLAVRCLYPPLIQTDIDDPRAGADLTRLGRRITYYFGVAVLTPVLAVIWLALHRGSQNSYFLMMGFVGLVGFGVAYQLTRIIQGDLAALLQAVTPSGGSLAGESAGDSFWMESR